MSLANLTAAERWAKNKIITPEAARQIGADAEERQVGDVVVLERYAGAIGWLFKRGLITNSQHEAANRLRADFEAAGLDPLRASDPSRDYVDQSGHKGEPAFRHEALDAFNAAIKAVSIVIYPTVRDVVLWDKPLTEAESFFVTFNERDKSLVARSNLVHGLIQLAEHYRLPRDW